MKINQLNPKIFNLTSSMMLPKVRDRLLEIVDEFLSQLNDLGSVDFKIIDIRLVGSNAAYNYTDKSDIDLHLVVNLSQICQDCPDIVQHLFNSEKSRFNMNYDISLKGIQVEIYVEDVRAGTVSNGIYSVLSDCWIKFPTDDNCESYQISDDDENYLSILSDVVETLESGDANEIQSRINQLYLLRKDSLEVRGEYGAGNLIFKKIRNLGYLDKLKEKYYEERSKELSLEGLNSVS